MDYKNGKIYRIVCNETGLCYVGSTTQTLTKRLSRHKLNFRQYLNEKYHYVSSFDILEKNNYDIVLIEEYPCENKNQLHKRERHYIETMDCVNKRIPTRPKSEYSKIYIEENKEKKKEYDKKRYLEIKKSREI